MKEDIELDEFLAVDGMPERFDARTFAINDDDQAIWAARSLAHAQRHIDKVERQAATEKERIDRWAQHTTKTSRNTVTYFTNALESYLIRIREAEGRKSLSLPDAEITSRAIPAKAQVTDNDVALKWLHENYPAWIRTKEEVDLASMKGQVRFEGDLVVEQSTGQIMDGFVGVEEAVSVTVRVSE